MSVEACAELVERGDPDRFRAIMAAPPEARAQLFPLYAFNLEVARALLENTELPAKAIAERALNIAADICIYTNRNLVIEELK